jgi:hypothetical protein
VKKIAHVVRALWQTALAVTMQQNTCLSSLLMIALALEIVRNPIQRPFLHNLKFTLMYLSVSETILTA